MVFSLGYKDSSEYTEIKWAIDIEKRTYSILQEFKEKWMSHIPSQMEEYKSILEEAEAFKQYEL